MREIIATVQGRRVWESHHWRCALVSRGLVACVSLAERGWGGGVSVAALCSASQRGADRGRRDQAQAQLVDAHVVAVVVAAAAVGAAR
jgi:hypothetical protein